MGLRYTINGILVFAFLTVEGWLYLAGIRDLFNGEIVVTP
jgi:hypothetical protein